MMKPTIVSMFVQRAAYMPQRVALRVLQAGGADRDSTLTWAEWDEQSRAFAAALIGAGIREGECVAILANNDLVWPVADLGVLRAGCVSVGLFPTSAPAQIRAVLDSCAARIIVTGSAAQHNAVVTATADRSTPLHVIDAALTWEPWLETGRQRLDDSTMHEELARRESAITPATLALLIYTSGSTGEPRGARILHRYITASAASIGQVLLLEEGDRSLSFLPYSHAAERIFGHFTRIMYGMEAGLVRDHTRIWQAAAAFRPTIFGGLPRFFEKVVETLQADAARAAPSEHARWQRVLALGAERSRLRRSGVPVPPDLEREWTRSGAPIFQRVRDFFGGDVRLATSGGATLPPLVAETLDAVGLTVLGAYGLTEHLCVACNRAHNYAFDGVGPPMPGTTVRIADDGEILVRRCDLTFDGYHGDAAATAAAFTDDGEWLLTGDIGSIDAHGMLHVTGRKKELIALSTGKKVAPQPIEAALISTPLVAQAVLYGEGRKFVSALLTLRPVEVEAWARSRGIVATYHALLAHPDLNAELQRAVDAVNEHLSAPERIRRFLVLERELTAEENELTPTLKVRRHTIAQRFHERFDALYRQAE